MKSIQNVVTMDDFFLYLVRTPFFYNPHFFIIEYPSRHSPKNVSTKIKIAFAI